MRGYRSPVGTERIAPNGYTYVQTPKGQRLKHHIIAEKKFGRPINTDVERVIFIDLDRTNFDPDNIDVQSKKEKESRETV
jgi:hypothetical protein